MKDASSAAARIQFVRRHPKNDVKGPSTNIWDALYLLGGPIAVIILNPHSLQRILLSFASDQSLSIRREYTNESLINFKF